MDDRIPRICDSTNRKCLKCDHARPHFCRQPYDVCIQGDLRSHYRLNVNCEPIPTQDQLDKLHAAVEEAEEAVADAREEAEEAAGKLDDAESKLAFARAELRDAKALESARDYVEADAAAVAAMPVI